MTRHEGAEGGTVTTGDGHHGEHQPHGDEIHLPGPTIWPITLAAGITLLGFGVLTHWVFSVVGMFVTARALGGWIGELRDE